MATTPKGIFYPGPNDPNDISAHLQSAAEFLDDRPGITALTTVERDALTGVDLWDGRIIYNLTAGALEVLDLTAGTWSETGQELLDQVLAVRASIGTDLGTTDSQTEFLINNPSATRDALSATNVAQRKDRVFLNLLDFGATGDGTTDDTTAFTALTAHIDSLKGVARGFDIVIPDRSFVTSVGLVLDGVTNAAVRVQGSIKVKSGSIGGASALSLIDIKGSSSRIRVEGPGLLDGNRAGQTGYSEYNMGVKIDASSFVTVTGLDIKNTAGDNVYVRDSSGVRLDGNRFTDPNTGGVGGARQGVAIVGGNADIQVTNNLFWSASASLISGRMAIDVEPDSGNVDRVLIEGNTVSGSEWNRAISARSLATASISRLRIRNNDLSRFVLIDGSGGGTLAEVEIADNTLDSSIVCKTVTSSLRVVGNTVRRQDIDVMKSALIYFSACSYVTCHDNILRPVVGASATKGIWSEGGTVYLSIQGNLIVSQGGASMTGIDLDGALTVCTIDGNVGVGNNGTPMTVGIDLSGLSGQSYVDVGAHNHFDFHVTTPISGQSKARGAAALNGRRVREGGNDSTMGAATLAAGTVTVTSSKTTANSRIHLTVQSLGTVTAPKAIAVTGRSVGNNFVITSSDITDTSVVAWELIEPA